MSTFTKDLIHKPNTYRFKSDGRKRDPMPQVGRGEYLLPGAYNYDDFAKKIRHLNLSYGFKNVEVHNLLMDRNNENPDLGPFTYPIENYLTISNSKEPSKYIHRNIYIYIYILEKLFNFQFFLKTFIF